MPGSIECLGRLAALLLTIALVTDYGCSSGNGSAKASSSELLNDILDHQREFDEAMISAIDRSTAEAAKIVMQRSYEQMLKDTRELEKANRLALASGAMSDADFSELESRVREERKASDTRCRGQRDRIMNDPELKAILKPVLDRIEAGPFK